MLIGVVCVCVCVCVCVVVVVVVVVVGQSRVRDARGHERDSRSRVEPPTRFATGMPNAMWRAPSCGMPAAARIFVLTSPGAMPLTRTRLGPSSAAATLVTASTAALAAEYIPPPAPDMGRAPTIELMLMADASPYAAAPATSSGAAAFSSSVGPVKKTRTTSSKSALAHSEPNRRPNLAEPAVLTRTASLPSSTARATSTSDAMPASVVASAGAKLWEGRVPDEEDCRQNGGAAPDRHAARNNCYPPLVRTGTHVRDLRSTGVAPAKAASRRS